MQRDNMSPFDCPNHGYSWNSQGRTPTEIEEHKKQCPHWTVTAGLEVSCCEYCGQRPLEEGHYDGCQPFHEHRRQQHLNTVGQLLLPLQERNYRPERSELVIGQTFTVPRVFMHQNADGFPQIQPPVPIQEQGYNQPSAVVFNPPPLIPPQALQIQYEQVRRVNQQHQNLPHHQVREIRQNRGHLSGDARTREDLHTHSVGEITRSTNDSQTFIWTIPNIRQHYDEVMERRVPNTYITSPFFTCRGYKFYIMFYLCGNDSGANTHISLYCKLICVNDDSVLRVTVTLLDQGTGEQRHNITVTTMNIASEFPQLTPIDVVFSTTGTYYVENDVMYISIKFE